MIGGGQQFAPDRLGLRHLERVHAADRWTPPDPRPLLWLRDGLALRIPGRPSTRRDRGYYERRLQSVAAPVLIVVVHGGMIAGVLPRDDRVAWEPHLFGLLAGWRAVCPPSEVLCHVRYPALSMYLHDIRPARRPPDAGRSPTSDAGQLPLPEVGS